MSDHESSESESSETKGDPNPNRLMEKCLDKLDGVLFTHGLEFRHDEEKWEDLVDELSALIFKYWDDKTGGDSSYEPGDSKDGDKPAPEPEVGEESEASESVTLGSDSEESAPKKMKK